MIEIGLHRLKPIDTLNWAVERGSISKEGKHKGEWYALKTSYFSRLSQAVSFLVDSEVLASASQEGVDAKTLAARVEEIRKEILEAVAKIESSTMPNQPVSDGVVE